MGSAASATSEAPQSKTRYLRSDVDLAPTLETQAGVAFGVTEPQERQILRPDPPEVRALSADNRGGEDKAARTL